MPYSKSRVNIFEQDGAGPNIRTDLLPEPPPPPIVFYNGEIRLLPFSVGELPENWYFLNGDQYALTSPVGMALNSLPATFKTRWGITTTSTNISLPKLFDSSGDGYFLRAVDGSTRVPGSVQTDAIRNITSDSKIFVEKSNASTPTGALKFTSASAGKAFSETVYGSISLGYIDFNASLQVPTAAENRPKNIGLLPCMYLEYQEVTT